MARPPRKPTRIGPLTHIHRERGAWSVQVTRRGRTLSDHFSDAVWGGREPGKVAAQRFRDELLQRVEPDDRVRRRPPRGRRSKTGIAGVTLERHVVDGHAYTRYSACWQDPDEGTVRRRFLVGHYGRRRARALAAAARAAGVARSSAVRLARQREEAARRLRDAPPMPRQVRDPMSRKGISMARRRPRRTR